MVTKLSFSEAQESFKVYKEELKTGKSELNTFNDVVKRYLKATRNEFNSRLPGLEKLKQLFQFNVTYEVPKGLGKNDPIQKALTEAINAKKSFYQEKTTFAGSLRQAFSEVFGELHTAEKHLNELRKINKLI